VALLSFALIWSVQNFLIRAQFYPLLALQGIVYDRGMTVHARQAAAEGKTGPVVVVPLSAQTFKSQDLRLPPGAVPGQPGEIAFNEATQRAFHARVVDNLRELGARVVVFDLLFDQKRPEFDPTLARALRQHGKVILAALDDRNSSGSGPGSITHDYQFPAADLRDAAAGMGFVSLPQDPDSRVRQFPWWSVGMDPDTAEDVPIPSLGVAAAALYGGANPRTVIQQEVRPRRTFLGTRIQWMPQQEAPTSFITFFGTAGAPAGKASVIPYEEVFTLGGGPAEKERLRAQIRDKIVLIGNAAQIFQDYHFVPVISNGRNAAAPGQDGNSTQKMPGVEIQAHIIQTALGGRYVRQASEAALILLLLTTCLAIAALGRMLNPWPFTAVAVLIFTGLNLGSILLLANREIWMEPVTASAGLAATFFFETVFMYFAERQQRLQVRRQLSRHVGPSVADQLAEDEWPEFCGEAHEISMLFSDLQGFTTISETMSSQETCTLLNAYFGIVFPILDRYEGTLDKLIGDGMMAYFGWPARNPDHAGSAIRCAVDIQNALDAWLSAPENAHLPRLRTRIGIHSGEATIGEIGYGMRVEFTVIGDIVNVASRLEGMNKEFGTRILISEATREAAGEIVPMVFRGAAAVRGKKEPMPVYSVEMESPPQAEAKEPERAVVHAG
jgi:class 3 adenylate cyclase/CHASE2 domain-containing sensor protein